MPKRTAGKKDKSIQVHVLHLVLEKKEFAAGSPGMVVDLLRGTVACIELLSESANILVSIRSPDMRR